MEIIPIGDPGLGNPDIPKRVVPGGEIGAALAGVRR